MAGETKVNVQQLKDVGTLIGYIVDEHSAPIKDLGKVDPNAGKFDAAQWIQDLFVDRRDAVATHVKYLESAYQEINDGLIAIAKEFEGVDSANGDAIAKFNTAAKGIIDGMGKAAYDPVMKQGKESYETGDDKKTGDKDTFDFSDPKNPKILEFNPKDVPGMEEFMTTDGLGKDDKGKLDFNEQGDIKGDHTIGLESGPPPATTEKPDEKKPDEKPKDPPPVTTGGGYTSNPGKPLSELKNSKDPNDGLDGEKDSVGKTFRWYKDSTGQHQSDHGNEIWWTDGKAYITDGNNHFVEYHEGTDAAPHELKRPDQDQPAKEQNNGGHTYRYYNGDNGQQQTHNGNKIWWMDGKSYVEYTNGSYTTFVEYKY